MDPSRPPLRLLALDWLLRRRLRRPFRQGLPDGLNVEEEASANSKAGKPTGVGLSLHPGKWKVEDIRESTSPLEIDIF